MGAWQLASAATFVREHEEKPKIMDQAGVIDLSLVFLALLNYGL